MKGRGLALCGLAALLAGAAGGAQGRDKATEERKSFADGKSTAFRQFLDKVSQYEKLRAALRSGIPAAGKKATAQEIVKHQTMLAEKIQEARKDAKQGDIFTPEAQKAFRRAIDKAYSGKRAAKIDRTIAQGEPVDLDLHVNRPYPEKMPFTTVPPTLLQHFPRLAKKIEYRIAGEDLVLQDTESNLVIDIFSGAFPNAPPHS